MTKILLAENQDNLKFLLLWIVCVGNLFKSLIVINYSLKFKKGCWDRKANTVG